MGEVSTIGLDIAKSVFQIYGVDRDGEVAIRKRVSRAKCWSFSRVYRPAWAWIGLVPKQHSTGGKERLGGISKQGNRYLRWLLCCGRNGCHPIRASARH